MECRSGVNGDGASHGTGGAGEGERAAIDGGAAGVGVCCGERECAGAVFGEATGIRAIHRAGEGRRLAVGIENHGGGAVFDAGAIVGSRAAGGELHGAAGEGDVASGAEGVGGVDAKDACGEGGAASVGVVAREDPGAGADFDERDGGGAWVKFTDDSRQGAGVTALEGESFVATGAACDGARKSEISAARLVDHGAACRAGEVDGAVRRRGIGSSVEERAGVGSRSDVDGGSTPHGAIGAGIGDGCDAERAGSDGGVAAVAI